MAGLSRLERAVGDGVLEMGIVVDQRYAKFQHERQDLIHPTGGQDHYLTNPLYARAEGIMSRLARVAITPTGSALRDQMRHEVEGWVGASVAVTPRWLGDLPGSHAPYVTDSGENVYRRRPVRPRLSDEVLRLKNRHNVHPSRRNRRGRR